MLPEQRDEQEYLLLELGRINSELAAQRRLNATVAHDLATPAQVVIGLSEMMLEHDALDPVARAHVEQLRRSALTMSSLIEDLSRGLSLGDRTSLAVARVELAALVSSVVARSRILSASKDIAVSLRVAEIEGGYWIDADAAKIERALTNLIGNAIKFSPRGTMVSVELGLAGSDAVIEVSDQGPGIPAEGRDRIFQVFHREPDAAHVPGRGLGLFITRQIVESHRGRVELVASRDVGATFALRLPLIEELDAVG